MSSTHSPEVIERIAEAIFERQQTWVEPLSEHSEFTWIGLKRHRPVEAQKFGWMADAALDAIDALYKEVPNHE